MHLSSLENNTTRVTMDGKECSNILYVHYLIQKHCLKWFDILHCQDRHNTGIIGIIQVNNNNITVYPVGNISLR